MKLSDTLDRTAEILLERGHNQHAYIDRHTGTVCLSGALRLALGAVLVEPTAWANYRIDCELEVIGSKAVIPLAFLRDCLREDPICWNDAEGRTLQQVLDMLHDAKLVAKKWEL